MTIAGLIATTIKAVLHRSTTVIISNKTLVERRRCMSKVARWADECYHDDDEHEVVVVAPLFRNKQEQQIQQEYEKHEEESCWIPDPRTGIYYPKGQEWVMKDIPDGAATFAYNYWFRNSDTHGV